MSNKGYWLRTYHKSTIAAVVDEEARSLGCPNAEAFYPELSFPSAGSAASVIATRAEVRQQLIPLLVAHPEHVTGRLKLTPDEALAAFEAFPRTDRRREEFFRDNVQDIEIGKRARAARVEKELAARDEKARRLYAPSRERERLKRTIADTEAAFRRFEETGSLFPSSGVGRDEPVTPAVLAEHKHRLEAARADLAKVEARIAEIGAEP